MKKSNLLKLSFWTMALFAAVAFTSCVKDNADNGMPYLEVTPDLLEFTNAGEPVGTSTITVKTNRPWDLSMDSSVDWITTSATSGNGDAVVEFVIPASSSGRSATVSFSLRNNYGAYITRDVAVEQGEIGPITRLLGYIKSTWPTDPASAVALGYNLTTVEGVILANNAGGNNRGKLYVGDNITQPGSAIILYSPDFNTIDNYPVGRKVRLDLSQAKYAPYKKLRELTDVAVTVLPDPAVALNIPSLSVAQFNSGSYQGQYVKINDVTPADATVDKPWTTTNYQTLSFLSGATPLAVYMRGESEATAFAGLTVQKKTGAIFGAAEQFDTTIQLLPTDPEDIEVFIDATPKVTTLEATDINTTAATLNGSLIFIDNVTEVGFQYMDYAAEPVWTGAQEVTGTLADSKWSANVTGLTQGKKYSFRAYAKTASDTYYGDMKSVTPDVGPLVTVDFTKADSYPADFPVASANKKVDPTEYTFGGQKFTFAGSTGEGFYTPAKAYVMWGKKDAYILLPAIAGKSLARVRCTVPVDASAAVQVGVFTNDGTATVQGGDVITWTKDGFTTERTYIYDLAGTAANTAYRLQIASAHNAQLAKIELWYNDGATPGRAEVTVTPTSLTFGAAANTAGLEVATTTVNADGLNLYAELTPGTGVAADQFTKDAAFTAGKIKVYAKANASETEANAATLTVYLAASESGERKASATVAITQAPSKPKTVAELVAYLNGADVLPAFGASTTLTDWNGMVVEGYIAANNASNNSNNYISVVDPYNPTGSPVIGAVASGIMIYNTAFNTDPATNYPVGAKARIVIGADSKCKNNSGMLRLEGVTVNVDKSATTTLTPVPLSAAQFNSGNYQGMYVAVLGIKYKQTEPQKWSAASTTSQVFVAGGEEVIVRTFVNCAWASDYISTTKVDGGIAGIVQYYASSASATPDHQLYPQTTTDVEDFRITTPMIVGVNPSSIVFAAAGGSKDIALSILNQGGNALSTSGLTAPFSATVSGSTVTVTATANTGAAVPAQTLTIALAGGNSVTVTVSQLAPGAKEYDLISTVGDLTAGTYYMAGFAESYTTTTFAPYSYHVWNGTLTSGSSAYAATVSYEYDAATGVLTANPANTSTAAEMQLVAVAGKVDTYYIKVGDQYLTTTSATANHSLALSATAQEWTFSAMASPKIGILATSTSPAVLGTAGAATNLLRSYKTTSVGSLVAGLFFFKKN